MASGDEIVREWDVWGPRSSGGYSWFYRQGAPINYRTAAILNERGLIECREGTHPYSGHHRDYFQITEAGRAALATEQPNDWPTCKSEIGYRAGVKPEE
jgi:hypothetical protein